jgi:acetolactate synthase I/II/III large subunit
MRVMDVVAAALQREGVKFITGFPFNQIFDSAAELGIRPIMARTERVAINIADGFSRMSAGRAFGVTGVQYGPGAEASFGAIAQAFSDSVPILVLPGGYDSNDAGVVPNFSSADQMRGIAKTTMLVNHPHRAALMMSRAFAALRSGRGGPVIVEVPDDLMKAEAPGGMDTYTPVRIGQTAAAPTETEAVIRALREARSPMLMVGRGVLQAGAWSDLRRLAEALAVPVMTTLAGKSAFPEDHALALGTGGHSSTPMSDAHLAAADLIVAIGTTLNRSHYTSHVPAGKRVIQIVRDPADLSQCYPVEHLVTGDLDLILADLAEAAAAEPRQGAVADSPAARIVASQRAAFMAAWGGRLTTDAEPISPYRVIGALMKLADRAKLVVTHDSGNPRDQVVPFFEALVPLGYVGWGKSTPLGSGLGLAMGAKLAKPDWLAVNFMGDSSFGMVGMDVETGVREGIPVLTIVFNNGRMGGYTRHHPVATRTHGINLQTGRYADVAIALGAAAERVERVSDLEPALLRAIRANADGRSALVEVMTREEPEFPHIRTYG